MIEYTGQLSQLKFTDYTVEKHRKHHKQKDGKSPTTYYCNDIFTFDIEVTSAWQTKDGKIIGYEKGHTAEYWNELEPLALCYIWQFSYNDTVYYGRELKDFLNVLADLSSFGFHVCVFVHNLSYEFAFLDSILTWKTVFARTAHKVMKCVSNEFPLIEFRCTYMLTRLSLEKWGSALGIEKLVGYLDYNKIRTPLTELTPSEMAYAERDCMVVFTGIRKELETYGTPRNIPLTQTGKVRRVIKERVNADDAYMKQIKKLIPNDADEYERLRRVFSGGYTHASRFYSGEVIESDIHGLIHHKDIASSYPAVMCGYKMPYSEWGYIGRDLPDVKDFENRAYIMSLTFINICCVTFNTYIQASKVHGHNITYDNGRVMSADEITLLVTEYDYMIICNTYEWSEMVVNTVWSARKQYLPAIFISYVLELYHNKTALKGIAEKEELYKKSKEFINALFGMSVTSIYQADVEYDENTGDWNTGDVTREMVNEHLNKLRYWRDKRYFCSYSVGVYITSIARFRLWQLINYTDRDLLYTDTDSIFYLGDYDFSWFDNDITERLRDMCKTRGLDFNKTRPLDKHGTPHPLGVLTDEEDATAFITLGAKKYLERHADGKLYLTVSGINKDAVKCLNGDIYAFKDGFIFDKDNESVTKKMLTYCVDMPVVTYPDGYVSNYKRGVNMRPTGYEIHITNEYQELIDASNFDLSDMPDESLNYIRGIVQ